jgi:hypothetical protein
MLGIGPMFIVAQGRGWGGLPDGDETQADGLGGNNDALLALEESRAWFYFGLFSRNPDGLY